MQATTSPSQLQVQPAFSQYLAPMAGDGWLAVGDAAFKVDPLSSAGIHKALQSGIAAAEAIGQFKAGQTQALQTYHQQTQHQFERYLSDRYKYYRQETRWAASPFWQRRHGHISLAPQAALYCPDASSVQARLKRLDQHLSPQALSQLCHLCNGPKDAPRRASDVVAEFLAQTTPTLSAHRPIAALEYLMAQQVIKRVA